VAPERPPQPTPVQDPVPLLPEPPATDAKPLAAQLQRSLQASGLFYESHLAQWAAGERSLSSLRDEPQGRVQVAARAQDAARVHTQAFAPADASPQVPAPSRGAFPSPPPLSASPGAFAQEQLPPAAPLTTSVQGERPTPQSAPDAIDQRVTAQVRTQIESIDARQVVWQGQPWPGLHVQWRIDEPPEHDAPSSEAVPWTSRLTLSFPRLGEVTAELVLAGSLLRVRLHAEDAASRAALMENHALLAQALDDASLRLMQFAIDE
jgi:hypothetical protein